MLALITPLISHGVIDNTVRNTVTLQLWGIDGGEPLEYTMRGNCLRDIAGCRVSFVNKGAAPERREEHQVLRTLRDDHRMPIAGDITLSRREPDANNKRALSNLLSIEFFLSHEMRILIETSLFSYEISLPQWQMGWAEANAQEFMNMEALREHVALNVRRFRSHAFNDINNNGFPPCDWDYRLNRAEACMSIYPSVRRKYQFSRDGANSIAYVMDRTDILARHAAEDEEHLPPTDTDDWDLLDFVEQEYAQEVDKAMHHRLFQETNRMTALVQKHVLVPTRGKLTADGERFVNGYSVLVSHILATILLTRQKRFPADLALRRARAITERLNALSACAGKMEQAPLLLEACSALLSKLDDFSAKLQH